jgi:nitroreductase
MDALEAIKTRRSIGLIKPDSVPQALIEQILDAGTYAPNHFRTEPWRFFVLTGNGRDKLGNVFEEITASKFENPASEDDKAKIEKAKKNPLRAPVIIAVGIEPSDKARVIQKEEYAAVNSAIQNMLIASHALGLGAIWRTGDICYHEKVRDFFGLSNDGEILAFVYIGYANMEPPKVKKTNFKEFTTWIS